MQLSCTLLKRTGLSLPTKNASGVFAAVKYVRAMQLRSGGNFSEPETPAYGQTSILAYFA